MDITSLNTALISLNAALEKIVSIVWGLPMICVLLGAGLFFTAYFKGIQFRLFFHALKVVSGKVHGSDHTTPGELTHFKALCTALSGTVGLGNIAGVAVAITLGGPGATFWMIVVGLLGMAVKFTECSLACIHRETNAKGVMLGGPMYYIRKVPGGSFLSKAYAFALTMAALGAANLFQSNQVSQAFKNSFDIEPLLTALFLAVPVALVILGGVQRIGYAASVIVPFMAAAYLTGCLITIGLHIDKLPETIALILSSAFAGTAAVGGFTGAAVSAAIKQGVRRALFSNEAGLGTAATAHAMVKTNEPMSEGVVALLEPFIDTVIICTITAMTILITGSWQIGGLEGVALTSAALNSGIAGLGTYLVPVSVYLFALSTIISWFLYGEQAIRFLIGDRPFGLPLYKLVYIACILIGAKWQATAILNFSDICFAFLVLPNVWAMLYFRKDLKQRIESYITTYVK